MLYHYDMFDGHDRGHSRSLGNYFCLFQEGVVRMWYNVVVQRLINVTSMILQNPKMR